MFFDPNGLRREMLWENVVPALDSPGYYDALTTLGATTSATGWRRSASRP